MSVTLDEHCQSTDQGICMAGSVVATGWGCCVVSSGMVFGTTQCLRNYVTNSSEGSSGKSKNWRGKMGGELKTA
jgi:hypothetical protein